MPALDLDAVEHLINQLSRPVYTWRMWHNLARNGRDTALSNAGRAIDAEVLEYVRKTHAVISPAEHKRLLRAKAKLRALENAGVDNWQGYDNAMGTLQSEDDE